MKSVHLKDPLDNLLAAGLRVLPIPPDRFQYMIGEMQQGEALVELLYCVIDNRSSQSKEEMNSSRKDVLSRLTCSVFWDLLQKRWILLIEGLSLSGFSSDELVCSFVNFSDLASAVITFYNGSPDIYNGWVVPYHRHPELDKERVQAAIAEAQVVTPATFTSLLEQYNRDIMEKFPHYSAWERALASSFLKLQHITDPHRICMLLRNATRAYIVEV